MKKRYTNINHRKVDVAILTLDKVDFRTNKTTREEFYKWQKVSPPKRTLNVYAPNNRGQKYVKQKHRTEKKKRQFQLETSIPPFQQLTEFN